MAKELEAALTEWFWSSLKAHRIDSTADHNKQAMLAREQLTELVTNQMRDHFQRYLRLWIMEQHPDASGDERKEALRLNTPKLEEAIEFFGKSMTQGLQAEFVNIGEELDEKQPKDPKKYIAKKIEKVSKEFFSRADDLAEDVLNGSPKAKRAGDRLGAAMEPCEIKVRIPAGVLAQLKRKAKRMGFAKKGGKLALDKFVELIITQYLIQDR